MREKRTKYEGRRGTEHEGLIPVTDIVQDLTSVNIDPMVSLRSPDIQPLRCGDLRRYPLFNTEWTSRVNCRVHCRNSVLPNIVPTNRCSPMSRVLPLVGPIHLFTHMLNVLTAVRKTIARS